MKRLRGNHYANGCPPKGVDFYQAILGDRGEAKRTYADDTSVDG